MLRKFQDRVPIVEEGNGSGSLWMRFAKKRMEERRQMTKVSIGGELTVNSMRKLRKIAAET